MDIGFGSAILLLGGLLAISASLSGLMRGTALSISVLAVALGAILAEIDVVSVSAGDESVIHLVELALILTLFSDGMFAERELLRRHWGPVARAIVFAMPITLGLIALAAKLLFKDFDWAQAFLLAAVLSPTDPVVTSSVVKSARVPAPIRHVLNLESGLNDGLALPFVLFFLVLAGSGGGAGHEALKLLGEALFGALVGLAVGGFGGRLHRYLPGGGLTFRYEGIYAVSFGLVAFGLADVTIGNGLIAAFVAGLTMGATEKNVPEAFVEFSENVSAIAQVLTFFVFGALIVATNYDGPPWRLGAFIVFAIVIARPVSIWLSFLRESIPGPQKAFVAWFGPKGVASMLFALFVLNSGVGGRAMIFDVAAFTIVASIAAHGLTDTLGARWVERRLE